MFTKKHFEMIAEILKDEKFAMGPSTHTALCKRFAKEFKQSNSRFDEGKFFAAAKRAV